MAQPGPEYPLDAHQASTHSCLHLYHPSGMFEDALGQVERKAYMGERFIRKAAAAATFSPTHLTQGGLKAAQEGVEAQAMLSLLLMVSLQSRSGQVHIPIIAQHDSRGCERQ